MYFGNGSQNDHFLFNGLNSTNSCEGKMFGVKVIMNSNLNHTLKSQKRIWSFLDFEKKKAYI